MAKLYFKYGAMGSSKTANALITRFNYEERGMQVWLIKPSLDVRDGADFCHRIVIFGREICTARSPMCERCPLSDLCQKAERDGR